MHHFNVCNSVFWLGVKTLVEKFGVLDNVVDYGARVP